MSSSRKQNKLSQKHLALVCSLFSWNIRSKLFTFSIIILKLNISAANLGSYKVKSLLSGDKVPIVGSGNLTVVALKYVQFENNGISPYLKNVEDAS